MKIDIKCRWSGRVLFSAELSAEFDDKSEAVRLGAAVKVAFDQKAYLRGANLRGANLRGAYLRGANLDGANLRGANLDGAYLDGANLNGAYLRGANLDGANLDGAYLNGAYLRGANLDGANLDGANLNGAKIAEGVTVSRAPIQILGLRYPVTIWDAHMQIGCQFHPLADWAAFDDRRILEMDGRTALNFWRQWKEPLFVMARTDARDIAAPTAEAEAAE